MINSPPEILNVKAMAARLGVAPLWLRIEAAEGRIPSVEAMHEFLFNPAAVVEALARRAAEGAVEAEEVADGE